MVDTMHELSQVDASQVQGGMTNCRFYLYLIQRASTDCSISDDEFRMLTDVYMRSC